MNGALITKVLSSGEEKLEQSPFRDFEFIVRNNLCYDISPSVKGDAMATKRCKHCNTRKPQKEYVLHQDWCRECIYDHDLLQEESVEDEATVLEEELKSAQEPIKHTKPKRKPTLEQKEKARLYRKKYAATPRARFKKYANRAAKKCLEFNLCIAHFEILTASACEYCGTTEQLGFDRVDNTRGYTEDNVVPCCGLCNRMKGTLSRDEFLLHISRISNEQIRPKVVQD